MGPVGMRTSRKSIVKMGDIRSRQAGCACAFLQFEARR